MGHSEWVGLDFFLVILGLVNWRSLMENAQRSLYNDELERVQKVFRLRKPSTRVFWVPGNHDIGFGNKGEGAASW